MSATPEACARELLETVPLIMGAIRTEMRRTTGSKLSVPQFRTLLYVGRHPESSLSQVADHIGLTLPSMPNLVDCLVSRRLADRGESSEDRRRLTLSLTERGVAVLRQVRAAALRSMARRLSSIPSTERAEVSRAMDILHSLFGSEGAAGTKEGPGLARKRLGKRPGTRTSREIRPRRGRTSELEEKR